MKNHLITLCFVLSSACLFSQTLIPDPNFEQALIDQNIDSDGILNGQVPTNDINSLLDLDISNSSINNLTGLEDFDNLRFLNCSNNNLTSLDLSSNFLYSLDCSYNMISVLNLSNQPELENIDCSYNQLTSLTLYPTSTGTNFTDTRLKCNNNLLTSLDLSGQYLLNYLDCSFNNIQNLLISTGDLLELYVNNNNLTELDFTNNDGIPAIDFVFDTKSNPNLCCIAVNDPVYCTANYSSFKDPTTIYGSDCAMTLIPDPNFEQALIDLNIDSDNTINGKVLTSDINWRSILDVSNKNINDLTGIEDFDSLNLLDCSNNNITSLDLSNNSLEGIYCNFNSLSVLDLSNQNSIEYIECNNNQLTSLLLGNSGEDVRLRCNNNMLTSIDVTGYYLMDVLECSNNQIQSLDLSNNVDITRIIANNNNLSELLLYNNNFDNMSIGTVDFNTTSNPNLFCIEVENAAWSTTNWINVDSQTSFSTDCSAAITLIPDPNFEQALIDQNIDSDGIVNGQVFTSDINSLLDLDISNSSINNLTGLEDFDNLRFLNCSNNNLTSLDLSSNFLYSLDCSYNMISVLNLSNQPELENIDCSYNQLTSLTLYPTSTGTNFTDTRLKCNNNLLTSLDLSGQYLLNYLDCSFNNIQNLLISTGDLLELYVNNNNLTELDFTNNDGIPAIDFVFDTKSNPNLCCIAVNDPVYCTANYSSFKDPTTIFGSDCAMTLIPDPNFEQALIDLNIDSDNTINGKVLTSDIDWISILDVSNKNISDLTGIEDFASLILLSCANNNLTSIDVSNNSLQGIYCDFNSLSVLDLSNQNGIEYIDCSNNQLTSLLLGNSGEDVRLRCNNNMLSTLNVTGYYLMDVLECSNNQIQSLDLSNNVDITRIIANNNNLSELLLYNNNFDNMSIGTVDFNTTSNPNLFCIEVENAAWSTTNWINVDSQTSFSENCTLDVIADNDPDENINLALLEDATLSGSVSNGRGTPQAILYDPLIEDYSTRTNWNEYGVGFGDNLGRPDADNGFKWQVDWPTTKAINYVTFGGVYYNQPQPNALWRISYLNNDQWMTLDEGQGGWVDSGIYEWDGTAAQAITADALRVQIYSDGETDLVSIHLRGRGGISNRINDSGTETKATLIQYLPPVGSPIADFNAVTNVLNVDFDASNSSDNNTIVDYQWNFGDGYATNSTSVVTTHTYLQSGTYLVTLKIIDNDGLTDIVSKTVTVSDGTAINEPDENINLALLEDANLSGSVGSGRGTLEAILYDPSIDDYFVRTDYNEYGVGFGENLGRPEADNGFFWQVDWSVPKSINYITFGGTYNNQPQPNAMWRISYLNNEDWITLDEGQGGWIDSGIYEWDGTASPAITAEALRVQIYSDGNTDLKSIHLRGRGGLSYRINDTNTATKATLIQYLPASTNVTVLRNEKPVDIMKLSPNPATSNVTLSFTVTTEVEVIEVSDLTGRLVSRFKGGKIDKEGIQISVKGLPIGVYNVKATSTTGEIYPVKLIKI